MWVDKKTYFELRDCLAKATQEAHTLAVQNQSLTTTMDWMRMMVNKLEQERAQMLLLYTGVKISVPTIHSSQETDIQTMMAGKSPFEDVGDEVAAKLGVGWAPDGTVLYQK